MMDNLPLETPNLGLIYDLFIGVFRPQVVWLALQLDAFTPLVVAGEK